MSIGNIKIKYLFYFVDIAKGHSFFEAAAMHNITQSAFSKSIQKLEEELGIILIDRSHYPVTLTEQGQKLYQDLMSILPNYKAFKDHVSAFVQSK